MSSSITEANMPSGETAVVDSKYQIRPCPVVELQATSPTLVLSSCPKQVGLSIYDSAGQATNMKKWEFRIDPASGEHILSPDLLLKAEVRFSLVGPALAATPDLTKLKAALPFLNGVGSSYLGLYNLMNTLTVKINQQSITRNVKDYLQALSLYAPLENENFLAANAHTMPDFSQTFAVPQSLTALNLQEMQPYPLGGYQDARGWTPRTAIKSLIYKSSVGNSDVTTEVEGFLSGTAFAAGTKFVAGTVFTAEVVIQYILPVPLPLFTAGVGLQRGIPNIKNLQISIDLDTDYNRLFSRHPSSVPFVISSAVLAETPKIEAYWYYPPSYVREALKSENGNYRDQTYECSNIELVTCPEIALGLTALTVSAKSATTQFNITRMPKKIMFWAERQRAFGRLDNGDAMDASEVQATPSVYARIDYFHLTLNGQARIFTNYDADALYKMSKRNGLVYDRTQALQTAGYVLCVDPANDFGASTDLIVGESLASAAIKAEFQITNLDKSAGHTYIPRMALIYDEHIIISAENQTEIYDTMIANDSERSVAMHVASAQAASTSFVLGAGFFGDVWNGIKKGVSWAVQNPGKVIGAVKDAVGAIKSLKGGRGSSSIGGAIHTVSERNGTKTRKLLGAGIVDDAAKRFK